MNLKIFIITLFLALIFSMGVVAANENITIEQVQDSSNSFNLDKEVPTDILGINSEEESLCDVHVSGQDLNDIDSMVDSVENGETVYLDGKIYTGNQRPISIYKDVTIVGGSSLNDGKTSTLHATGNINLMSIYSSKVTLIGINFINGNFKGNGGALSIIESDVTLINCTFECNKASDKGGALYSINSNKVVIDNCSFIDNNADTTGAAYFVSTKDILIKNSKFTHNFGKNNGGAININNDCTQSIIKNCSLENNSADFGGAIVSFIKTLIVNSSFTNNSAIHGGGAVMGEFDIKESIFYNNSAKTGGAIYANENDVLINDSIFIRNSAGKYGFGGAIYSSNKVKNTYINNCLFSNTSSISNENSYESGYSGSAVYVNSLNAVIMDSTFKDNYADVGAAICVYKDVDKAKIKNCTFIANAVKSCNYLYGHGGAICIYESNVSIECCDFLNNSADCRDFQYGKGGAIYMYKSDLNIYNSSFRDNKAFEGGAINSEDKYNSIGYNLHIFNCSFFDNCASESSGSVVRGLSLNKISINDSIFRNNTGAAVDGYGIVSTEIKNSSFLNNKVSNGAGIKIIVSYDFFKDSDVSIEDCLFNNNTSYMGGALYLGTIDNLLIKNSYFICNTAKYGDGGAIVHYGGGNSIINNCTFYNNSAGRDAGALYLSGINNQIINSTFISNRANIGGGAIMIFGSKVEIKGSLFENNSVGNYGGALSMDNGTVLNSRFNNNFASHGGAIYGSNSIIINSSFTNNQDKYGISIHDLANSRLYNTSLPSNEIENYYSKNIRLLLDYDAYDELWMIYRSDNDLNTYMVYCVEGYVPLIVERSHNWDDISIDSYLTNNLSVIRNLLNQKDVSEYLKILIYLHDDFINLTPEHLLDELGIFTEEDYEKYPEWINQYLDRLRSLDKNVIDQFLLNKLVWVFTEEDYENSNNTIIQKVIDLYDNGLRISDDATKILKNGTIAYYNFAAVYNPVDIKNLMVYNVSYKNVPNINVDKKANVTEVFNGNEFEYIITVTNKGNETLNDVYIEDNNFTSNADYIKYLNGTCEWKFIDSPLTVIQFNYSDEKTFSMKTIPSRFVLNSPLKPGDSASIKLVFRAKHSGKIINNVTAGFNNVYLTDAVNDKVTVYSPNFTVQIIPRTPHVKVKETAVFDIVVTNTGDYNLTGLFVKVNANDYDYMINDNWYSINDMFYLNKSLNVGKNESFSIMFSLNNGGIFTFNLTSGSNQTSNKTIDFEFDVENPDILNKTQAKENSTSTKIVNETKAMDNITNEETLIEKVLLKNKHSTGNPLLVLLLSVIVISLRRRKL